MVGAFIIGVLVFFLVCVVIGMSADKPAQPKRRDPYRRNKKGKRKR